MEKTIGKLLCVYDTSLLSEDEDLESLWTDTHTELSRLLDEKNKHSYWYCTCPKFGWQARPIIGTIEADDGEVFLKRLLPKTDCTFKIHAWGEDGFAVQNFHHDSPVGNEWYYCRPATEKEIDEIRTN